MKSMSRNIITLICATVAASAALHAQNIYDAAFLMQNEYFGTARSMALGNAMTAVGGDIGSIVLNPAGSAVASYGQLSVTPAYISSRSLVGTNERKAGRMTLPNVGLTVNFDTGRDKGVKRVSFGAVISQTAQYLSVAAGSSTTSSSSLAAERASAAAGYPESLLGQYSAYENSDVPWDVLTAYRGGLFGSYGIDGRYVAISEGLGDDGYGNAYRYIPGQLSQAINLRREGSKNDVLFNFGVDVSDVFYFGLNIGMPSAHYSYRELYSESAVSPERFPLTFYDDAGNAVDTYFCGATSGYSFATDIDGIYAKAGVIARLFNGFLRIGAAIQSPALLTVSETWAYDAASYFSDSQFDLSAYSPTGQYSYQLRSPYMANFGAAAVLGSLGLLSVDYEYSDFGHMRFSSLDADAFTDDLFYDLNEASRLFAGCTHSFRFGLEIKPLPALSLRAGMATMRRVEHSWTNNLGNEVFADSFINDFNSYNNNLYQLVMRNDHVSVRNNYSFGIGYASRGSFFADLAVMICDYPVQDYAPYYDYYSGAGDEYCAAPVHSIVRSMVTAALTFGWRF